MFVTVLRICILGILLAAVPPSTAQDFRIVPVEPLAFTFPCNNDAKLFAMNYVIRPNSNNWEGIFFMDRFSNVYTVRLQIVLENPATITLKNTRGTVRTEDNLTFVITTQEVPPAIRRIEFRVNGDPLGYFPNLISLRFNDDHLCDNSNSDFSAPFLRKTEMCGKSLTGKTQGLLANAYDAAPGAWPWHVAIYHIEDDEERVYRCGGTLLNANTVLTAGHCMFNAKTGSFLQPSEYILHLGKHNERVIDENTKEVKVSRAILHNRYISKTLSNDIGILKLESNVTFTKFIQPICMWTEQPGYDILRKSGRVVGWGYTEKSNIPADILREASMPVVSFTDCLESNRPIFGEYLSGTNYCAGYRNGTSVCSGDSGGGMYIESNGVWRIRGLVSLGVRHSGEEATTCNPLDYVLFTDVLKYIPWIIPRMN